MRDITVFLIIFGSLPFILKKPYIGILVWSWLSYMNPHRLTYGFAYDMPFNQIVVIVLLFSMLFSKDSKKLQLNFLTVLWILFIVLMGITTIFAYFPDEALIQYIKVLKIQFVTLLTLMLITDMDKLRKVIWVICLSIGFFSIKGGVFTLLTGGGFRVWGPSGSFIEDNNALAVAILMTIPLMFYLYQQEKNKKIKLGIMVAIILSLFTVLGTQSRGALLAIGAVGVFYWFKSEKKFISAVIVVSLGACLLAFMPETWYERMDSMNNYEKDASAMGRIHAWEYAINAANDNILGMGFESWSLETFSIYSQTPDPHAAHSIYFGVLGDHGWIGLILFLLIFYLSWKRLKHVIKYTNNKDAFKDINLLAKMLQVSFIAYLVGGIFLSLSYFDLPWHLVCFVLILSKEVEPEPELPDTIKDKNSIYVT